VNNFIYSFFLEIVPPRAPSPPPLVIKYQEPAPPTPPPLILREAPPPLPPRQETTVITRVLPPEPQSPRRVIYEREPPVRHLSLTHINLHYLCLDTTETSRCYHRKMASIQTSTTSSSYLRTCSRFINWN